MEERFKVEFLAQAVEFMDGLDNKAREKIYYNIRKAQVTNDPELFKKVTETIWEFRTLFNKTYFRLFAFWDSTDSRHTLVIATNGLIKKTGKVPKTDLEKAERIRKQYLEKNK